MKLTKAQRKVLKWMAEGRRLIYSQSSWMVTPWHTIRRPTVYALEQAGFIFRVPPAPEYSLTDAGRAALERE